MPTGSQLERGPEASGLSLNNLARARWWRDMSSRHIIMGLYQEGSRERNRFEQGLGSVAGINQTWSLGENPNGDQGAGLGTRDRVAARWPTIGQGTRHFLYQ